MRSLHVVPVVAGAVLMLLGGPAAAQRGGVGPIHYDTTTVQTVSGVVQRVDIPAPQARGPASMQVVLLTGGDSLVVHLGPAWYVDRNHMTLAKGDRVDVTGSRTTVAGQPVLVAREISRAGQTLKLRTEQGMPLWSRGRPGPR